MRNKFLATLPLWQRSLCLRVFFFTVASVPFRCVKFVIFCYSSLSFRPVVTKVGTLNLPVHGKKLLAAEFRFRAGFGRRAQKTAAFNWPMPMLWSWWPILAGNHYQTLGGITLSLTLDTCLSPIGCLMINYLCSNLGDSLICIGSRVKHCFCTKWAKNASKHWLTTYPDLSTCWQFNS